jgi:hypothetical protein
MDSSSAVQANGILCKILTGMNRLLIGEKQFELVIFFCAISIYFVRKLCGRLRVGV